MRAQDHRLKLLVVLISTFAGICACDRVAVVHEKDVAPEPQKEPQRPVYASAKKVSSDCGVEYVAPPPPGFAEARGVETKDMPPPMAGPMAVGVGREQVATDWDRVSPGVVLIEPGAIKETWLVNNKKETVAAFTGDYYTGLTELMPDGNRLASGFARTDVFEKGGGGFRGCIEEYAADGSLVWRMNLNTDEYIHHHDFVKLENGNILAIVWEKVSADEAVSQGRNPEDVSESGEFWYDAVIEVNPYTLQIVWEWSMRHHLVQDFDPGKANYGVIADHPELFDINIVHRSNTTGKVTKDWTHVNAIDYNPELDQILLSSNHFSEIWIIDHGTTPMEAMAHSGGRYGKGGDFLYRWGNPENYDRGTADDRMLYNQHDPQWIVSGLQGEGHIMVFNNGDRKLRPYTTVVEFASPLNDDGSYELAGSQPYAPQSLVWEYNPQPPERFFSFFISGAQRLANGNTLVNQGAGAQLREVTPSGEIVWEYEYPRDDAPHMFFRANKYPEDHPAVIGLMNQ